MFYKVNVQIHPAQKFWGLLLMHISISVLSISVLSPHRNLKGNTEFNTLHPILTLRARFHLCSFLCELNTAYCFVLLSFLTPLLTNSYYV